MEKHWVLIELFALSTAEAEIDDEGIERDSEEIDDEKFSDTKELDHVLEVSFEFLLCFVAFMCVFLIDRSIDGRSALIVLRRNVVQWNHAPAIDWFSFGRRTKDFSTVTSSEGD